MCGSAFIFSGGGTFWRCKNNPGGSLLCDGASLCEKSKFLRSGCFEPSQLLCASFAIFGLFLAICGIRSQWGWIVVSLSQGLNVTFLLDEHLIGRTMEEGSFIVWKSWKEFCVQRWAQFWECSGTRKCSAHIYIFTFTFTFHVRFRITFIFRQAWRDVSEFNNMALLFAIKDGGC